MIRRNHGRACCQAARRDHSDRDAAAGEVLDDLVHVIESTGPPVHPLDHHRIPRPHNVKHGSKLWALNVLAGGVVGENAVERLAIELALRVLIVTAHVGRGNATFSICSSKYTLENIG